jgi:long-subunit acyl-CoA synthetase (AMP-forming)
MSEHSGSATEKIMNNIMDTIADKLPKQKSDNIMSNIMDTISDKLPKQKSGHFDQASVSDKVNKMFGRQRSLHGVLGGGKCMRFSHLSVLVLFMWAYLMLFVL